MYRRRAWDEQLPLWWMLTLTDSLPSWFSLIWKYKGFNCHTLADVTFQIKSERAEMLKNKKSTSCSYFAFWRLLRFDLNLIHPFSSNQVIAFENNLFVGSNETFHVHPGNYLHDPSSHSHVLCAEVIAFTAQLGLFV